MKLGDVVTLVGQDVPMTVEYWTQSGIIGCVWFDSNKVLHRAEFKDMCLVAINDN